MVQKKPPRLMWGLQIPSILAFFWWFPKLRPHKKGFEEPSFVVEDFDGKPLTLRQLEPKDVLPSSAELRRLLIDDLGKAQSSFKSAVLYGFGRVFNCFHHFKSALTRRFARSSRPRTCHHP